MRAKAAIGLAGLLLVGAKAPPAERVVSGDGIGAATVNGTIGRIRIDPGATSMPVLDRAFAERAGLTSGMFAAGFMVGPTKLRGPTSVTTLAVGGKPFKRRVAWFDAKYAAGADGAIGPGGLPDRVIRFVLRPAVAGERTVALPMVDGGGLGGGWGGLYATIPFRGAALKVRFDPHQPRTMVSAGLANSLANANGGAMTGAPSTATIVFGVERPVRRMRLATPLAVGMLSLAAIDVRVGDYGNASGIAEADVVPDPDEVVVTGKHKRDRSRDRLTIGGDALAGCSSIVFDKPAKVIRLTCR